jgi:hypothetical protein
MNQAQMRRCSHGTNSPSVHPVQPASPVRNTRTPRYFWLSLCDLGNRFNPLSGVHLNRDQIDRRGAVLGGTDPAVPTSAINRMRPTSARSPTRVRRMQVPPIVR